MRSKIKAKSFKVPPRATRKDAQQDAKIKKIAKKVNRITSEIEDKIVSQTIASTNITSGVPFTLLLNGLSQGTTVGTRLGNKCRFSSIDMRLYFYNTTNTFSNDNIFRVILVKEKPALGAAISLNSLLGSATPIVTALYEDTNRDFKHRFKILMDRSYNMWDNTGFCQRMIHIRKRLNFITNYARGNAGTIADIDVNSLYLVVIAQKGTVNIFNIFGEIDLRYEDA